MLSHVMIGSNDLERSRLFYTTILGVLGAEAPVENDNGAGQTRWFFQHDGSLFCVTEPISGKPATVAEGFTIGFRCNSPEQVKEFHDVAVANGAVSIEEPPGPRESTMGLMHLCYFRDPDGHKICGIFR